MLPYPLPHPLHLELHFEPPRPNCRRPRPLSPHPPPCTAPFWTSKAPDFWLQCGSGSSFHSKADPELLLPKIMRIRIRNLNWDYVCVIVKYTLCTPCTLQSKKDPRFKWAEHISYDTSLFSGQCHEMNIFLQDLNIFYQCFPVLRIRDIYRGSRIRLFSIPDPNCLHPGSRILIKEFKYFNPQKTSLNRSKNMIWVAHPGSGCWLSTHPGSRIPDPGIKKAADPGSRDQKGTRSGTRIRIRSTGAFCVCAGGFQSLSKSLPYTIISACTEST